MMHCQNAMIMSEQMPERIKGTQHQVTEKKRLRLSSHRPQIIAVVSALSP